MKTAGKRLLKEKNGAAAMVRFEKALMLSKALADKVGEGMVRMRLCLGPLAAGGAGVAACACDRASAWVAYETARWRVWGCIPRL